MAVTIDDVRRLAVTLPRTEEALVRDCVKFRVRGLVYVSFSRDETVMGFAYPKDERVGLIASDPETFVMPVPSDERFNWVRARLCALDTDEMRELVFDAWTMVVPKKVVADYVSDARAR